MEISFLDGKGTDEVSVRVDLLLVCLGGTPEVFVEDVGIVPARMVNRRNDTERLVERVIRVILKVRER